MEYRYTEVVQPTWKREPRLVNEHMANQARDGWELVTANTSARPTGTTLSFFWRKDAT